MQKFFLAVFFVLVNIAGFLIPASLSYGDAPITGTLTLSEPSECDYGYTAVEVPFTLKLGNKVGDESRGYYKCFFAADKSTNVMVGVSKEDCAECNYSYYLSFISKWVAEGSIKSSHNEESAYVYTTNGVNEIQLI